VSRRHILYIVTDDWFFVSHFMPMARAARDAGFKVSIAGGMAQKRSALLAEGFATIDLAEQRQGGILAAMRSFFRLRRMLAAERPDLVHCIALRPVVLGGLARKLGMGSKATVLAVTGLGFLGAEGDAGWKRRLVFRLCCWLGTGSHTRFLFENASDGAVLGLSFEQQDRAVIVGGAGIDPDALKPTPMPTGDTLRLALVARMIWSKGVDLAVDAVRKARATGAAVTLDLYGEPDSGNPATINGSALAGFNGSEGIAWHGRSGDIAHVWATHHMCILPSRGGEGLPRSLLEAAGCGRGIITTDVPGCRDFVRDGIDGAIVKVGDADDLARRIIHYAENREAVAEAGRNARNRVLDGYTEQAVATTVLKLYQTLLAR
jgi:glycosyltransferase involved in cell wall biosynthesis